MNESGRYLHNAVRKFRITRPNTVDKATQRDRHYEVGTGPDNTQLLIDHFLTDKTRTVEKVVLGTIKINKEIHFLYPIQWPDSVENILTDLSPEADAICFPSVEKAT